MLEDLAGCGCVLLEKRPVELLFLAPSPSWPKAFDPQVKEFVCPKTMAWDAAQTMVSEKSIFFIFRVVGTPFSRKPCLMFR